MKIYKYPLIGDADLLTVRVPEKFRLIHLDRDPHDQLCVWGEVDGNGEPDTRELYFRVFGTGWPIEAKKHERLSYFATLREDPFVWHYYTLSYVTTP